MSTRNVIEVIEENPTGLPMVHSLSVFSDVNEWLVPKVNVT